MKKFVLIILLLLCCSSQAAIKILGDEEELIWYNGANFWSIQANSSLVTDIAWVWPADAGTGGQALITDGTNILSWDTPSFSAAHNILSATHDATTNAVTRGSIIYGNSTPKWDELVIGASGTILRSDGTDAAWSATTNITTLGTITTGTWNADVLTVSYGGTGASSLTDGGVLFGSGTGAITAMSVLADGAFIVGDGTTDPVAESGNTARTSLGVGTGDSPTWTGATLSGLTSGSVIFAGTNGVLSQDNSNLFWNNTNNNLGVGTDSPGLTITNGTSQKAVIHSKSSAGNEDVLMLQKIQSAGVVSTSFNKAGDSETAVADGERIGNFIFRGFDGTDYNTACSFGAIIDGAVSANTVPMALLFRTSTTNSVVERLRISPSGDIGINEPAPETFTEWTSTAPYLTLHNSTHEDSDGGRESRLNFKGEQSGGEETTLVREEIAHDGTSDDEKGYKDWFVNTGSDGDSPTFAMRLNSDLRLGLGVSSGLDPRAGLTISGDMDILHTSSEADDHAFEIDVDAAGFGDVKAIDIAYITGELEAGEDEGIILLNIDQITGTPATGGEVFGLEVLATEGSAEIFGLKVGAVVGAIHQDSGTFINPTLTTDNTPTTDVPDMGDGNIATTTTIFEAENEYIIIGAATVFEEIEFILTTTTSNPGIKPTFWYSSAAGGGFTQFTPVDGTNGFRNTGVVAWDASDLVGHIVGSVTGTYDIKVIRTKAGSLSPSPVLGFAKTAATTEYIWDKDGNVNIKTLTISTVAAEGSDVDKFLVDSSGVVKYRTGTQILSDVGGQAQGDVLDDLNILGAVGADSEFLVGTGAGALAWESGTVARTSIGLGTGASPTWTGATLYSSAPVLRLRDTGATADATNAFVEFGGTNAGVWSRTGWVGDGSSGDTTISLWAEVGNLQLGDSSGIDVLTLSGGNAVFTGTVTGTSFITAGNIGVVADTDLLQLAANALTVNGTITLSLANEINFRDSDISIGSTVDGFLDITADTEVDFFYNNADVGDAVDGQSVYINRRAAEGDDYIRLYIDNARKGLIGFSGADDLLQLEAAGLTVNGTINTTGVYKVDDTQVLDGTTLGANVVNSSLTSVGTIATGTWQGTTIAINQGGTGQTTAQAAIDALSAVSGATNEHVLTKDTASGNAVWKVSPAAGGVTKWNAIGDADGAGSIDFVTHTQTIDIGVTDSGGPKSGLILDVTGLSGPGTTGVVALEITTAADDDTEYIPIAIYDDSGAGNDLIFKIDYRGGITFPNAGILSQDGGANTFSFQDNNDEFQITLGGTEIDLVWSDGALNLRNSQDGVDAIVEIEGNDAGEKGILRVLSDGDDKYIELYHDDTDSQIVSSSGDIQFTADGIVYNPSGTQAITAATDTILANSAVIVLNPDADYTMTSAPTIANGSTGQILYIICANGEANTVTVQDQDTLANSNLHLGAATRAISGKDVLTLLFDGTTWIEVSYANN